MSKYTFKLALLASFFCLAFGKTEKDAKKPHIIKKSSFCFSGQDDVFCTATNDYKAAIEEIIDRSDKLSKGREVGDKVGACANALKKAICSKPSPLCFEGKDDPEARRVCRNLRQDCEYLDRYEDQCVTYLQMKYTNLTCVAMGKDEKFEGYCPRPSRKMPVFYWQAYKLKSEKLEQPMGYLDRLNKITGIELVSSDCMQKIKEAACVPLYCSKDEKSIVIPNTQEKCNAVLECINNGFDKYEKVSSILKPVKKYLTGGCDQIVEAIKASTASRSSKSAYSIGRTQGVKILLIAISLAFTYLY